MGEHEKTTRNPLVDFGEPKKANPSGQLIQSQEDKLSSEDYSGTNKFLN